MSMFTPPGEETEASPFHAIFTIEFECANCNRPVPMPKESPFYWSLFGYQLRPVYCAKCAERANAPMIKPQPKGTTIDGWDV